MEPIRLNKYLSEHGIASRREADRLIEEGRVTVNGKTAEVGTRVTEFDTVAVSGKTVEKTAPEKAVYALNKPRGVVTTTRRFKGEENVISLLGLKEYVYPIGRLDKDSEGLLLLTNDGALAKEITTAGRHEKEYEVTVEKELTPHFLERMEKGVFLKELNRETMKTRVMKTGKKRFRIVLKEGLNREIRRMCETLGNRVVTLKRIRIMNVSLGDLKTGEYRKLSGAEYRALQEAAKPGSGKQAEKKES